MSIRVFCSHRSVDKPEVEALAARLRAAGIDAWLDKWEILAGDSIVNKINAGLEECTVGLLFFSNKQQAGGLWYAAEQDSLTQALIEDGKRLIPVMIDADAPIPPLLRPRARRGIDEFDAIADAIRGVTHKPPLAEPISEAARHSFVIHLSQPAAGQMRLLARLDERDIGRIDETPVPRAFAVNLARSLHADFGSTFRAPAKRRHCSRWSRACSAWARNSALCCSPRPSARHWRRRSMRWRSASSWIWCSKPPSRSSWA